MKILDRYIARHFIVSIGVAYCFLLCVYMSVHLFAHLGELGDASRVLSQRGMNLFTGLCRFYALMMPFILTKLGPFGALLAGMWTVQRMTKDVEITAAQVAGVSLHRIMLPILACGALVSLGLTLIRTEVLPRISVQAHQMDRLVRGKTEDVMDGPFLVRDDRGLRISIRSYEPSSRTAHDVEFRSDDLNDITDVETLQYRDDGAQGPGWYPQSPVRGSLSLPGGTNLRPFDIEIESRGLRFLGAAELSDLLRRMPDRLDLQLIRQTRVTYPFVTVVLLLLGLPIVLKRDQQNVYAACGVCLLVSVLYFGAENLIHGLAERDGLLSPGLAAWIPVVVFGTAGALTFQDL